MKSCSENSKIDLDLLKRYVVEGWGGRTLALYHTSTLDRMIEDLLPGGSETAPFAVFATGSFGRQELCPYSDIDILIFSAGEDRSGSASRFLYALWDKGLSVSHSFRTPGQCLEEAFSDMKTRTALLDARFICGNGELVPLYREEVLQKIRGRKKREFTAGKLREISERHQRQGNSPFLLQPDIKESRGGLRDIHNAVWLSSVLFKSEGFQGLADLLPRDDFRKYLRAFDYLMRLRFVIHILSKRKNDKLLFEFHETAAELLGIRSSKKFTAVERMMRYYFLKARTVNYLSEKIYRMCGQEVTRKFFNFSVKKINGLFSISQKQIIAIDDRVLREDPVRIMEAFSVHAAGSAALSEHLTDGIKRSSFLIGPVLRRNRSMVELFMNILRSGRVYETLRLMHETGVLDRFIPEFGSIRHLMVNDSYHIYPVDEHSLMGIRMLESLHRSVEARKHLSQLLNDFGKKHILYLSLLLHDIGKSKGRYHEQEGYKLVKDVSERLILDEESRVLIEYLVKNHTLMSDIAFKHDLQSPEVIAFFSEKVQTEERLNALYLVTYADMKSVSDSFWTPWRSALLSDLYRKSLDYLRGLRFDRDSFLREAAGKFGLELRGFLEIMPEDYLVSTPAEKVMMDYESFVRAKKEGLAARIHDREDGTTDLTIIAPDRKGAFSDIVSVLAVRKFNIIAARLFTGTGWVLDRIRIANWKSLWWEGMDDLVRKELKEVLLLGKKIEIRETFRKTRVIESFIDLDNERGKDYTIVEIMVPDRPGLLYDLTRVFAHNGVNIISGRIYTEQEIANDIFYVNSRGGKLTSMELYDILCELWKKIR